MIELSVIFGLYVIGSLILIHHILKGAKEDRYDLEDRVMALSQPEALITHKALEDERPAEVGYVGEDIPAAVPNGQVTYEDE